MSEPLHPRLSAFATPLVRSALPTGNGFGASNLKMSQCPELVFPLDDSSVMKARSLVSIDTQRSSPLLMKVGQIFVLSLWLWCAIGADFCFNSVRAISTYGTQDV
ncbi:hypothetical protein [Chamaesiphon sp. VAR_48_metabat_403]|uniref:hypothetical protein n=1 Tax=Chamaesiphon sp. VAR_48_metabat_403 TaxID=2964700 RepID=UPI00286D9A0D|nr:hypothetical protein [Chamaesiphon sp. VAR_48_metabat_403]